MATVHATPEDQTNTFTPHQSSVLRGIYLHLFDCVLGRFEADPERIAKDALMRNKTISHMIDCLPQSEQATVADHFLANPAFVPLYLATATTAMVGLSLGGAIPDNLFPTEISAKDLEERAMTPDFGENFGFIIHAFYAHIDDLFEPNHLVGTLLFFMTLEDQFNQTAATTVDEQQEEHSAHEAKVKSAILFLDDDFHHQILLADAELKDSSSAFTAVSYLHMINRVPHEQVDQLPFGTALSDGLRTVLRVVLSTMKEVRH